MTGTVQLSDAESSRLERILLLKDVERQKRVAYPFWSLAVIIFIIAQAAIWIELGLLTLSMGIALLPLAFATFIIGMARFGYYKLFRLLHHQNAVIEQLQQTPTCNS